MLLVSVSAMNTPWFVRKYWVCSNAGYYFIFILIATLNGCRSVPGAEWEHEVLLVLAVYACTVVLDITNKYSISDDITIACCSVISFKE